MAGMMNASGAKDVVKGGILRVKNPPHVKLPSTLLDAMYLQLGKFVASGGVLRRCKHCGEFFECGLISSPQAGKSRRSIALFCSPPCKDRANYLKRPSTKQSTKRRAAA